ncbi:hypothetical protein [Oceanivirga salmonicida]|uniref:hypothetical protein n=2 Tax=Oceanivirga salmonicida TaxID=1769291 RepID=UPI0012E0FF0F|nr:hypothetical protein [Oceanivirga salmonicida]
MKKIIITILVGFFPLINLANDKNCENKCKLDTNKSSSKYNFNENIIKDKFEIDKILRDKLKDINVIDNKGNKINVIDTFTNNAIVMYGAPWCPDCVKEVKNILKNKKNKDFIYLIDPKKYTYKEFVKYSKNNKQDVKMYYVENLIIRERFNINWIPSTFEIKDGYITNTFKEIR